TSLSNNPAPAGSLSPSGRNAPLSSNTPSRTSIASGAPAVTPPAENNANNNRNGTAINVADTNQLLDLIDNDNGTGTTAQPMGRPNRKSLNHRGNKPAAVSA